MRFILSLTAILFFATSAQAGISAQTCADVQQRLQEGDIVFTRIDNWLYRKVADATKAWTTHVGVVVKEDDKWLVAESTIPFSKKTGICKFLNRTANGQYSVRRLKSEFATQLDLDKMKQAIEAGMYRPYDLHFNYDSTWLFCSKFVYDVYKQASGLEIGRIETLGDLRANNPDGDQTFWEYWFFGNVPWEQRTVTPQSQYDDTKLEAVSEKL